jgi:hypothetical protein
MLSTASTGLPKKPSILTISESLDPDVFFSFVTFLDCPKKGDPKNAPGEHSDPACSVVLGTF